MLDVFAPKRIAGIATRAAVADTAAVAALWARFFQQGLPQRLQGGIYSVLFDYEDGPNGEYTVLVGCEIPAGVPLPKGMTEQWIMPGAYELFDSSGPLPQSIVEGWNAVRSAPLQRAFQTDFEEYLPDNTQTIYVGVIPGAEDDEAAAADPEAFPA